jgi:hypothetical protein
MKICLYNHAFTRCKILACVITFQIRTFFICQDFLQYDTHILLQEITFGRDSGLSIFFKCTIYRRYVVLNIFMNILYNTLQNQEVPDHFKQVKVPGTTPYWKACGLLPITQEIIKYMYLPPFLYFLTSF